ncbi:hypothetical protein, partial [Pseudomonas sp. UMAB-40]
MRGSAPTWWSSPRTSRGGCVSSRRSTTSKSRR